MCVNGSLGANFPGPNLIITRFPAVTVVFEYVCVRTKLFTLNLHCFSAVGVQTSGRANDEITLNSLKVIVIKHVSGVLRVSSFLFQSS